MPKVEAIEETQRATERAMSEVFTYLKSSAAPTVEKARTAIENVLEELNCESPEGIVVVSGIASADPHGEGGGVIRRGEPIVVDIYPRNKTSLYFADMTRTVCLGEAPERLQKMYDAVLGAQELTLSLIKPGAKGVDIQMTVEEYFNERGFVRKNPRAPGAKGWLAEEGFIHPVGHGVSKKIHDTPRVGHSEDMLKEGDVITIEPGLYYKDIGGVRIEDMVLVTKEGYRNLTNFPKQLVL
jgi:Xaa-Pro aminopeptidase